ncbi:phage terminase small subunit P27 family [Azorhizobium sp. AG788]|uniref:phage terminase small subunit P27 family n=1 Tax=Azorhizobium sp. AG788 TaxID=2183897 RepID=UPI003138FEB6
MSRPGPKPEPASVKRAKGNPSRRPIGADPEMLAPAPANGIIPPPWLKGDGLAIWERRAPQLVAMRLLTQTDSEAFGRYCRNFARWLKMQVALDETGESYVTESAHGTMRRLTPEFMAADRLERQLAATEDRFGLNPAERQRIMVQRAAMTNFGDLFSGQGQAPSAPASAKTNPQPPKASSPIGVLQ